MDIDPLIRQVRYNCDVSDARHAGLYSVCGLAMRLRDLYKWEHGLPPWQEGDTAHVLDWIGQKEDAWEALFDAELGPFTINGQRLDPFATQEINSLLKPHNLFVGAGFAHSLKPTFCFAEIDKKEKIEGHTVWQLGGELARDLLTLPAFSQDNQVVLRKEAGRMFLWDQMAYINKSGRWPLAYALRALGLADTANPTIRRNLDTIWKTQKQLYIQHEIGELEERAFDRTLWREMLADYPHTPVELLIRTLKDLLADTGPHGPLSHLIRHEQRAGFGLYIAFGASFARQISHPLICAFDAFTQDPNWQLVADAVEKVRETALGYTRRVLEIYTAGKQAEGVEMAGQQIEAAMRRWGLIEGKN